VQIRGFTASGVIDAEVEPDIPQLLIRGDDKIARLFPNFENDEREYYSQTKIFPIMHLIVIKTEILRNAPWVAMSLFEAFMACRRAYDEFMQQPHRLSFAWGRSYLEGEKKFFKKSPFYQGLKENYNHIQNMIMFAQQQGMLAKPLTVDDLFIENTRAT
jgi:4,5-dihydroxyphthalate decarboxylase